jgi:hypothetical protein
MSEAPRQHCRNVKCRSKLPAPVENDHHAFCARGCHGAFYRSRCLVCEDPIRRKRESQKLGSGHKVCEAKYRKFPRVYDFPALDPTISDEGIRSARKPGLKSGLRSDRPAAYSLRSWTWGGDSEHDHSLYDRDGLTIARIVLVDGRYHLRTPVVAVSPRVPLRGTWHLDWPSLEEAKRGAESFALMARPLDPKLAARIKRDNETPHPMGPPLNGTPLNHGDAVLLGTDSRIALCASGSGGIAVPDFLRRS